MKKTLSTICLMTILFICIGCDLKPSEFDPKSKGWELLISGIVDEVCFAITENKKIYIIKFKESSQIKVNRFHNFHDIKEQDKGSVYKWKGDLRKGRYYYMWCPDDNIDIPPENKKIAQTSTPKIVYDISIAKYKWQNVKTKLPSFYQTVLVKLENNLVTTAYYTQRNIWKAEIDKNKMSGGMPLKNIIQWKLVDLE